MTTVKTVPIDWPALSQLPPDQLRRQIAVAYYQADLCTISPAPKAARGYSRPTTAYPLGVVEASVHRTITRCRTCGQWTCAARFQRVKHACLNERKDVA